MLHSFTQIRGALINYRYFKQTFSSPCLFSLLIRRISCWKCGNPDQNGSHCITCNALQEPSKLNYFELFGVKVSYNVDTPSLLRRYYDLQILFHPDKHSSDDAENQQKSEEFSTVVNKAYSTLTDPVERALYILKLNKIFIDETISSQNPDLLMLILEYDEEISEVKQTEDARKILQNVEKELQRLSSLASHSFHKKDFETFKDTTIQMTYYANILKSLKAKVREMGLEI